MKIEFQEETVDGKIRLKGVLRVESELTIDPEELASSKLDLKESAKRFLVEKIRRDVFGTLKVEFVKFTTVHRRFLAGNATSVEMEEAFEAVMSAPNRISG